MEFKDKNNQIIKDGDAILFSLEDTMEVGGFAKIVSNIELCFFSKQLNRYLPLSSHATKGGILDDVNVVRNHIDPKNEDV